MRSTLRPLILLAVAGCQRGIAPSPVTPQHPVAQRPAETRRATDRDFAFVFSVGGVAYVQLDAGERVDALTVPADLRFVERDGEEAAAIGELGDRDVPAELRAWKGRRVLVEGSCKATVTGFALVARVTGMRSYTEDVPDEADWDAASVLANGARVLAGRLSGCPGHWARAADLPAIVVADEVHDRALVASAREDLLASPLAAEADKAWREGGYDYDWKTEGITARVVRHPVTGERFVSLEARDQEGVCGGPGINFWGLYRALPDGRTERIQLRELDAMHSIEALVDLDGDGELEVIGQDWAGLGWLLMSADGEELSSLPLPFVGCPC